VIAFAGEGAGVSPHPRHDSIDRAIDRCREILARDLEILDTGRQCQVAQPSVSLADPWLLHQQPRGLGERPAPPWRLADGPRRRVYETLRPQDKTWSFAFRITSG
jgi:hypothetical protein